MGRNKWNTKENKVSFGRTMMQALSQDVAMFQRIKIRQIVGR